MRMILTKEDIVEGLKACGVSKGHHIFVHTSLKSLGFVVGGAETVIRALLEVVTDEGTIMMPSQTWKNLDPEKGVHWEEPKEWWPIIRENWPAYDKYVTPAIGMGLVADMFCKWPGAHRSDHPARSVAAVGKHAEYLTKDHDMSNIFGDGSPVGKLYELDGYILLLGVGYDKNTSLHLAETRADFTKKYTKESSAVNISGKRQWITYETLDVDDCDFVALGKAFDMEKNIKVHKIGSADVRYLSQRQLVDWTVDWMSAHRE